MHSWFHTNSQSEKIINQIITTMSQNESKLAQLLIDNQWSICTIYDLDVNKSIQNPQLLSAELKFNLHINARILFDLYLKLPEQKFLTILSTWPYGEEKNGSIHLSAQALRYAVRCVAAQAAISEEQIGFIKVLCDNCPDRDLPTHNLDALSESILQNNLVIFEQLLKSKCTMTARAFKMIFNMECRGPNSIKFTRLCKDYGFDFNSCLDEDENNSILFLLNEDRIDIGPDTPQIALELIEMGADIFYENKHGINAYSILKKSKEGKIQHYIQQIDIQILRTQLNNTITGAKSKDPLTPILKI